MAFPPSKKTGGKNIAIGEHATITQGKGGIPASLKIKNAGVSEAPSKSFIEDIIKVPTGSDKTQSRF